MKEHRDKGLCYNYDEKYDSDHQCTIKKFYLLNADDIDDSIDEEEEVTMEEVANDPNNTEDEVPKISYNAFSGISSL